MQDMTELIRDEELVSSCLDRLRKEALICLEGFPTKVTNLNGIIEIYAPKSGGVEAEAITQHPDSISLSSTAGEYGATSVPDYHDKNEKCRYDLASLTSYCTVSTYERGKSRHGPCRGRYYKIHRSRGTVIRRRRGSLGQLLVFVASKLATYTKSMVIAPSIYIIERMISMLFQRHQLKNAQCGPCADWSNSLSTCPTSLKEENTTVGSFISVLRPAAVQLIADTTILKRWLQAVHATNACHSSIALSNATRNTETIDCWAYELFFHLKYLQVNRARDADKVTDGSSINDEVTHMNLWHRMVQLRDNYIILYEILYANPKISKMISGK